MNIRQPKIRSPTNIFLSDKIFYAEEEQNEQQKKKLQNDKLIGV